MYYLMNKDNIIAEFKADTRSEFSDDVSFLMNEVVGKLPIGFENINTWLDGRKASKHNAHLKSIMQSMNCYDNEGFIKVTHAASINDTFWVRSDTENVSWNNVSLYSNQFSEVISRLAFEGVGLYDEVFPSTSPELTCDGSFSKCFKKEDFTGEYGSDIFLYKRGHEISIGNIVKFGYEPYCEQMASEIAKIISPKNATAYELVTLHGKTASRCNLFTNESLGYASYAKTSNKRSIDLQQVFEYFAGIGSEQAFREMLVIDSLCFNQDRHAGNYGVLFDNDTLNIIGMSPVFDLNLSLMLYTDDFTNIGDKLFEWSPKLGEDFTRIGQMGTNDVLRDRIKDIRDFSFSFRGDDVFTEDHVKQLETVVRKQAAALLSSDKLYTKDVFFSQRAADLEMQRDKVQKASALMNDFSKVIENTLIGRDVFISYCDSSDTVQIYVEKGSCEITLDFLKGKIYALENALTISFTELREIDEELWETGKVIKKELKHFVKGKNTPFNALFEGAEH